MAISINDTFTLKLTGATAVSGDDTNFTVTPSNGVDNISVEGNNLSAVTMTVGEQNYTLNASGAPVAVVEEPAINTTVAVTTKYNNKTTKKNYSYINNDAADSDIKATFVALNGLTDNTLIDIERVSKHSII